MRNMGQKKALLASNVPYLKKNCTKLDLKSLPTSCSTRRDDEIAVLARSP